MNERRLLQRVEQIKDDLLKGVSPVEAVLGLEQLARDQQRPVADLINPVELRSLCVQSLERQLETLRLATRKGLHRPPFMTSRQILQQVNHLADLLDSYPELEQFRKKVVQFDLSQAS